FTELFFLFAVFRRADGLRAVRVICLCTTHASSGLRATRAASPCSTRASTRASVFGDAHVFSCWPLQNSTGTEGRMSQIFCAEGESFPGCHGEKESKLARVSLASYGKRCLAYPLLSQH